MVKDLRTEYNFGELTKDVEWEPLKKRLRAPGSSTHKVKRFDTHLHDVNYLFGGGLPYGLTIFVGAEGTGKTLLSHTIAKRSKTLYFYCEDRVDAVQHKNVVNVDYVSFLPKWSKAVKQLFKFIEMLKPALVIVDSITTFLSETNKAVEEADVRSGIFEIARHSSGVIPIIALSQIRGSGSFEYPAGGRAVSHAPILYVWFHRNRVVNRWDADRFGAKIGDIVWTVEVIKDKQGLAVQNVEHIVTYNNGVPEFNRVRLDYSEKEDRTDE